MKYMVILKVKDQAVTPPPALMESLMQLGIEATEAGAMVQMAGLLPTSMGASVRLAKGKVTVTDGPFTEAKEVIGSFAIYEVASKDEAVEWTRRFLDLHAKHWPGWEGECEVRPLFEPSMGEGCVPAA